VSRAPLLVVEDRVDDLAVQATFEQVAARTGLGGALRDAVAGKAADHDDAKAGMLLEEPARRLEAVHHRKVEIDDSDVGMNSFVELECAQAVVRRADDLDSVLVLEQRAERSDEHLLVIHEHDANRCAVQDGLS